MKNSSLSNFILMSLLACMFFIACKKDYDLCEGEPDIEIQYRATLIKDDMKYFPYKGNETLTFISNNGDTAILVGKGQLFQYPRLRYSGNNDCTNFYHEHEIFFTEFVGDNPNFNHLRMEIFKGKYDDLSTNIYINNYNGFRSFFEGSYGLVGLHLPQFANQPFVFRDSTVLASLYYVEVPNQKFLKLFFYKENGIIAFFKDSNTVYTLQ
jgi:hypothetical protein